MFPQHVFVIILWGILMILMILEQISTTIANSIGGIWAIVVAIHIKYVHSSVSYQQATYQKHDLGVVIKGKMGMGL